MRLKRNAVILVSLLVLLLAGSHTMFDGKGQHQLIEVISNQDRGAGTFREALERARPGTTISFSRSVFPKSDPVRIELLSGLPPLDDGNVTVDASGAGVILDGRALRANPETPGLGINSNGNTVKGLEIINFPAGGICIGDRAQGNLIGGSRRGEGNVIGGNLDGIQIWGEGTANNRIIGNRIGTDAEGLEANPNRAAGIWIGDGARDNIIGGRFGAEGNLVSGNDSGIIIQQSHGNIVTGNLIGLDISGEEVIGNSGTGIGINFKARKNIVGGEDFQDRNVISGNGCGICLNGSGVSENQIVGNLIGTNQEGNGALGNGSFGVNIDNGAHDNWIGPYNRIANNHDCGIWIVGADTLGNSLSMNSIYANGGSAICNRNGGNLELQPPEINQVDSRSLAGLASPAQIIEVFSDSSDGSEAYEGETTAVADGSFHFMLPSGSFRNQFITATATDESGNTSQLAHHSANPGYGVLQELPHIVAPEQVSSDPAVIGTNLGLAVFCVLFFGYTSTVFNEILKNYHEEIANSMQPFVPKAARKLFRRADQGIKGRPARQLICLWAGLILLAAIVESFLDPEIALFGLERIRTAATLFVSGLLISGGEWAVDQMMHVKLQKTVKMTGVVHWIGLVIALGCVVVSRLLHFIPGYVYGILGSIYLLPEITDRVKMGKRTAVVQGTIFLIGVGFWGLSAILPWGLTWLEPLFLTIFLISIQGVFFALIPLLDLDGCYLWEWKKGIWFLMFMIVFFCFYHVSLNPDGSDIHALQQNGVRTLLAAMGIFGLATFVLWLRFPARLKEW